MKMWRAIRIIMVIMSCNAGLSLFCMDKHAIEQAAGESHSTTVSTATSAQPIEMEPSTSSSLSAATSWQPMQSVPSSSSSSSSSSGPAATEQLVSTVNRRKRKRQTVDSETEKAQKIADTPSTKTHYTPRFFPNLMQKQVDRSQALEEIVQQQVAHYVGPSDEQMSHLLGHEYTVKLPGTVNGGVLASDGRQWVTNERYLNFDVVRLYFLKERDDTLYFSNPYNLGSQYSHMSALSLFYSLDSMRIAIFGERDVSSGCAVKVIAYLDAQSLGQIRPISEGCFFDLDGHQRYLLGQDDTADLYLLNLDTQEKRVIKDKQKDVVWPGKQPTIVAALSSDGTKIARAIRETKDICSIEIIDVASAAVLKTFTMSIKELADSDAGKKDRIAPRLIQFNSTGTKLAVSFEYNEQAHRQIWELNIETEQKKFILDFISEYYGMHYVKNDRYLIIKYGQSKVVMYAYDLLNGNKILILAGDELDDAGLSGNGQFLYTIANTYDENGASLSTTFVIRPFPYPGLAQELLKNLSLEDREFVAALLNNRKHAKVLSRESTLRLLRLPQITFAGRTASLGKLILRQHHLMVDEAVLLKLLPGIVQKNFVELRPRFDEEWDLDEWKEALYRGEQSNPAYDLILEQLYKQRMGVTILN